jgi:hypothetical protein
MANFSNLEPSAFRTQLESLDTQVQDLDTAVSNLDLTVLEINNQNGSYIAVLADAGKVVRVDSAGAADFTVPPAASVAYPVGSIIKVRQAGAGLVTIVQGSGVTVHIKSGFTLSLSGQYAEVTLHKVAADTWEAVGDFATL